MKRLSAKLVVVTTTALLVLLGVTLIGVRWMHRKDMEQQVLAILENDNKIARMTAMARLRDTNGSETLHILAAALDNPDDKIRVRAGSELSLFHDNVGEVADVLIAHLKSSPSAPVRLSCAIMLMWVPSPAVRDAYRQALKDPFDKVVQIACGEVANRGGPDAAEALFPVLEYPSWDVRLEACKALITLHAADSRVISTLETMSREPEAAQYDAQIEEFDRRDKELGSPPELQGRWGKIGTILEQARRMASNSKG